MLHECKILTLLYFTIFPFCAEIINSQTMVISQTEKQLLNPPLNKGFPPPRALYILYELDN